jgi:hypothetical protein
VPLNRVLGRSSEVGPSLPQESGLNAEDSEVSREFMGAIVSLLPCFKMLYSHISPFPAVHSSKSDPLMRTTCYRTHSCTPQNVWSAE